MTATHDAPDLTAGEELARARFAEGLRELADWYDTHPALPLPVAQRLSIQITPWARHIEPGEVPEAFAAAARALGGHRVKEPDAKFFAVVRSFGGVEVEVYAERDVVCEARVVGTETVTEDVTEVVGKRTVQRDVVEWRCKSLLGREPSDGEAVEVAR